MRTLTLTLAALVTLASACANDAADTLADAADLDAEAATALTLDTSETRKILALANTASFEELDEDVALDVRAAENIVEQRPFATLAELDAVSYVGPSALAKMRDYTDAHPAFVHGIEEGSALAAAMLSLANTASETELDVDVALDSRGAANIVSARETDGPFLTLEQLDDVSYVAATAFEKLADHVDQDGDGVPAAEDCDDSDASLLYLGNDGSCAADSCAHIKATSTEAPDGTYTLADAGGGTYDVTCDMTTDGGGWTVITGEVLDDLDAITFTVEAGPAGPSAGGAWTSTTGTFALTPQADVTTCQGVVVRATAELPFTFTEWDGRFDVVQPTLFSHADDDTVSVGWGESVNECGGSFKFGTDQDTSKAGGEWGWMYVSQTWSFGPEAVAETDILRWETMDSYIDEEVHVSDISIKVR